jgi:hypothetical protein
MINEEAVPAEQRLAELLRMSIHFHAHRTIEIPFFCLLSRSCRGRPAG